MVKAKSVLTPGFKPVNYPKTDADTFGFFASSYKERDVDNNMIENSEKTVMNHWHPNRVIEFHLSDSFNKRENKKLKDGAYEAVRQFNIGLQNAGSNLRINLNEPSGKNPGDIRNSMIVLVEEPYSSAPLGYGPQTEDPITGEIISARTIMYLAGLQQYVKINYDEIGRAIALEAAKKLAPVTVEEESTDEDAGLIIETGDGTEARVMRLSKAKALAAKKKASAAKKSTSSKAASQIVLSKLQAEHKSMRNYTSRTSEEYAKRDVKTKLKYLQEAKNCSFKAEGSPGLSEIRPDIMKVIVEKFSKDGQLIPWMSLSAAQKKEVMDIVIPEVWVPVLLHELGHNLGLRHNFKGSEDSANFYSEKELKAAGVNHKVPYSTIMEYGDDLRTLPLLGKYDIAALKFAYARKVSVQDKDGKVSEVSVDSDLASLNAKLQAQSVKLVEYGYCTDEHVGPNPGCRRFDEGQTLTEIAQYLVKTYRDRYISRNTRDGRENFSSMDNLGHLIRRQSEFMAMRTFGELYERLKHTYNLADDAKEWTTIEWLRDLKEATLLTNRLLIDVAMTPDLHCAISMAAKPSQIIAAVPLVTIDKDAFDCSSLQLDPKYLVVGQAGKPLNDKKHPDSQNTYIDQIDVRGYWLDKFAAANVLFKRNMGSSFNKNFDNAWDIADLKPEIKEMLVGMLTNKAITKQKFTLINGQEVEFEIPTDYHTSQLIDQALDAGLTRATGLSRGNVYFSEVLAGLVVREANLNTDNMAAGQELIDMVSVKKTSTLSDSTPAGFLSLKVGSSIVYAASENTVGTDLIVDVNIQRTFGAVDEKVLVKLAKFLSENLKNETAVTADGLKAAVPELNEQLQAYVVKVSEKSLSILTAKLQAMISGQMMPESDIVKVLFGLPNR